MIWGKRKMVGRRRIKVSMGKCLKGDFSGQTWLCFNYLQRFRNLFLVNGLGFLPNLFGLNLMQPFFGLQIINFLGPLAAHLIFGFLLFFKTDYFIPQEFAGETESSTNITGAEIQFITFTFMGLYLLTSALPSILSLIILFVTKNNNPQFNEIYLKYLNPAYVTSTVAELIIGTWLLLGSQGLVNLIRKLRYAGLDSDGDVHIDKLDDYRRN